MLQLIFRLSTIEFKLKGTGKNKTLQIKKIHFMQVTTLTKFNQIFVVRS